MMQKKNKAYHYQVTLKVLVAVDPSALSKDLSNERDLVVDNTHDLIKRYGVEDVSAVIQSYKLVPFKKDLR